METITPISATSTTSKLEAFRMHVAEDDEPTIVLVDERAVWSTSYVNDLPDSSFLYIAPGGSKDADGKTTPRSLRSFPYKDANGQVDLPHLRNALSRIPQANIPEGVKKTLTTKAQRILDGQRAEGAPPSDGLIRAEPGGLTLREAPGIGGDRVLAGHFAVFDTWTEVNSLYEGRFMEQIAPGAFAKTIRENAARMRVLFEHGKDNELGSKPLGVIRSLEETEHGAAYEVALFDGIPPLVLNGLRHGQYGSSFRFSVVKQKFDRAPDASEFNPDALPERTITEARVHEFGPVTFPAYPQADAGIRSLTDRYTYPVDVLDALAFRAAALPTPEPPEGTPVVASRSTRPTRDYLQPESEVRPQWRL